MPLLLELFCGTHSVGREFHAAGWEVYSVDIDPARNATWTGDVRDFDPATLPRRPDMKWASPVCQMYSCARTKAKTPRDLEWADSLVLAALRIQEVCGCPMLMENPFSSMLKKRPFMQGGARASRTRAASEPPSIASEPTGNPAARCVITTAASAWATDTRRELAATGCGIRISRGTSTGRTNCTPFRRSSARKSRGGPPKK